MLITTIFALAATGCAAVGGPGPGEESSERQGTAEQSCRDEAGSAGDTSERGVVAVRALTPPLQGGLVAKLPWTVVFADGRVITRDPDVSPGSEDYPAFLERTMSAQWLEAFMGELCPEAFARLPASLGSQSFDYGGQEDVVVGVAHEGKLRKTRALGLRDPDEALPESFERADGAIAAAAREVRETGTRADIDESALPTVAGGSITEG